MADSLKDKMMLYGVTMGRRFTKKQKQLFISCVKDYLDKNNISYEIQEQRSSILTIENIIIGHPETSRHVIAAAYDTPSAALYPGYRWYPFQMKKNRSMNKKNQIIEGILVTAFLILAVLFLFQVRNASVVMKVILILLAIISAVIAWQLSRGRSVPCSFNMNSAAVALLMDLLEKHAGDDEYAFLLMDESTTSLEGGKFLKSKVPESTPVLFLSSLAVGSRKMLVHGKKGRTDDININSDLNLEDYELSDHQLSECILGLYPYSKMIIFGEREGNDFISPNVRTSKDNQVDMDLLQKCEQLIEESFQNETNDHTK